MGVITISRQYGSDGRNVGKKVAEALGYRYVDKELLVEVSLRAKVPVSEIEHFDEKPEHAFVRMVRKFLTPAYPGALPGVGGEEWWAPTGVPEFYKLGDQALVALDEDAYVKLVQEVMWQLADQGNVVIIGRGGQAVLANRSDTLHVRIVAPNDFRIHTLTTREKLSRAEAVKQLRKVNDYRKCYIKRHGSINWDAPEHYHLILNTGRTGTEAAAEILAHAARKLPMEDYALGA